MQEYTLTRTGGRPLKFNGEVVAEAGSSWFMGKDQNRWHEITIYKTVGGKYVLAVAYFTRWQGEGNHYKAEVYDTITETINALEFVDPLEHLIGYPPHPQFADKQLRIEEDLRQRWDVLISEILKNIPEAAERIE